MRRIRFIAVAILATIAVLPVSAVATGASLFADRPGTLPLFEDSGIAPFARAGGAPLTGAAPPRLPVAIGSSGIDRALFDVIASAEAGPDGYDAVQHGAKIRPPAPPTALTIAQINEWIDATPGQHHAIGRYQFIPATLRRLVHALDVPPEAIFSPDLQDRLALELVMEAGYSDFLGGGIERSNFLDNLAKVWAGLPTASGKSYYHGKWGNRATIARARFEAEMARVFPEDG